nr:MAG TPA: hypothetical protein [Caudoviricetes sp.]
MFRMNFPPIAYRIGLLRRDFAPSGATKGLSDRPLENFGSPLPELTLIAACENGNIRKTRNIF